MILSRAISLGREDVCRRPAPEPERETSRANVMARITFILKTAPSAPSRPSRA